MSGVEAEWKAEVREEAIEELREELREELKEGLRDELKEEVKEDFAIKMLKEGDVSREKLAKFTGFSLKEIEELEAELLCTSKK